MPKGSWREFENTAPKQLAQSSLEIQSKDELRVRVQKTRVGKGGKTVTVINGLDVERRELKRLLKLLKNRCGAGGTEKEALIELQGDQVALVLEALKKEGYQPKQSGG